MKISEAIKRLETIKEELGDVQVTVQSDKCCLCFNCPTDIIIRKCNNENAAYIDLGIRSQTRGVDY